MVMRIAVVLELKGVGLWGAGKESFEADTTTYRLMGVKPNGEPVLAIPGPYFKGLLRTWAYKLAGLLIRGRIVSGTDPAQTGCWIGKTCGDCIICHVFGYSGCPQGSLFVSYFYPVKREGLNVLKRDLWLKLDIDELPFRLDLLTADLMTTYLAHVRIDDRSGKAARGGLFINEAIKPGVVFVGEVRLHKTLLSNESHPDRALLMAFRLVLLSLAQLNYSFVGRRTRGKVGILKYELPDFIKEDEVCREVLRGLEWRS